MGVNILLMEENDKILLASKKIKLND